MANLIMEPNALTVCANKLATEATAHIELYERMKSLIIGLEGEWMGGAYESVRELYERQESVLSRYTEALRRYAKLLKDMGEDFERMDNESRRFFTRF